MHLYSLLLFLVQMADSSDNPGQQKIDPHFATKAIHVGQNPENWSYRDVVPPISLTTTYKQYGPNDHAVSISLFPSPSEIGCNKN